MTMLPPPARSPLWYHGWNIVGIAVLCQVAALGLTLNCFSLFLADWTREFHVPVSALALSITLFAIGVAIVAPVVGLAADRFPARWIYGLALCGLAGAYVLVGLATQRWQILLLYALLLPVVIGFSSNVQGQALVSRWFTRRIGLAMGITAFGAALAGVIFPPIVVALLPLIGWRNVWFLFAALFVVLVLPLVIWLARDRPTEEEGAHYLGGGPVQRGPGTLRWRDILARRNFWVTIGVFIPVQACFMSLTVNLAPLVRARGYGAVEAGELLSLINIAALCGKLVAGLLVDRLGNRLPLLFMSLTCAAGMMVLAVPGGGGPVLVIAIILVGTAGASWTLLASATAAEFGAADFGRAFGLICALSPIGAFMSPILARVEEVTGSYAPGLIGLGVLALFGAALATCLREKPRPALA